MKKVLFIVATILIFMLTGCNTSTPSTYISSKDDNRTFFYNVTFETNGGSYVPPVRVISGSIVTVPFQPKKEGTEFNGWYLDENLTMPYKFGEIVEGDMTLYARWLEIYTIHFETYGGTKIDNAKVLEGHNLDVPIPPIKNGYTFNGWYLDQDFLNSYNFGNAVNSNFTLYAYWV